MSRFIITVSKTAMVLFLAFGSSTSYAQRAHDNSSASTVIETRTDAFKEEQLTTKDLIRPTTLVALHEHLASEQEYVAAKETWIAAHPREYSILLKEEPASESDPDGTLLKQERMRAKEAWEARNPNAYKPLAGPKQPPYAGANAANWEQKLAAKQAWVDANPEEYARMLKEGVAESAPVIKGE